MPLYLALLLLGLIWAVVSLSYLQDRQERRRAKRLSDAERAARKRSWDDTY